uniref:Uncharacterized protein n=1 Tax=Pyxicephalus adspersus TaxID=30357 RepID=A0AAV2ZW28_PYXAD|nr:TPA: hypothetical protein GDO54_017694 [Pyxicephalus adspersus]
MCPYSRQGALFQGKALFGPGFFKPAAIRHRPCTVGAAAAAGRLILCRREMQDQLAELDEGTPGPSCRPPPGLVSEQAPSSWLQHTRQCVEGSRSLRLVIPDPQPVCVLAVQRYLGEVGRCRYHYDITLYDGLVQDTWLLSPELAHLVHDNRLRSGSRAAIGQCSYRYAEKRLRTGAVCIEDMEVRGGTGEGTVPGGQIVPLYGGRKHYLPLWNNDDPYGDIWHRGTEQQGNVSDFIKWSKTHREADYRGIVTIGGYHPYPQTPTTFAKYCGDNKVEKMISTIDELQTLLGQLQYREHRRVAIQGIIAACRYVGNEELEALEVRSHEELVSFVSVAHHGNPELDTVDQSLSAAQSKCSTGVTTSQSIPEEAVPHSETSNVTVVTRRRKHAAEDDTQTELRAASESSNVSMVKRIRIHAVEDLSVNISKSSHTVQYPTRDVNTSIHESLFSEADETTRSSVAENEESDGTLSPGRFWESALWPEVKHNLKSHLHYSTVFPESLLRKFDPKHKEFLLQQYNLHPAKLMKSLCTSDIISQDFSTGGPGHYEVTILGINHDLAIDVCLPVYKNFTLFGSNCLPAQMQCLSTDWNAESQERHWLSLKDELKEYARAQDRLHTICILDICHLGKGKVEIFLNRVYYPITEVLS